MVRDELAEINLSAVASLGAGVPREKRDGGQERQEDHEGIEAGSDEQAEARMAFVLCHHIRAMLEESAFNFVFRQPRRRTSEPFQSSRRLCLGYRGQQRRGPDRTGWFRYTAEVPEGISERYGRLPS